MLQLSEEDQALAIRLAVEGKSLTAIAEALGAHVQDLWEYRIRNAEFREVFASARDEGLENIADSLLSAHEEFTDVQRARLFSENARWLLSKRRASVYGDRVDLNVSGTVNLVGAIEDARRRASLLPASDQAALQNPQTIDVTPQTGTLQPGYKPGTLPATQETRRDAAQDAPDFAPEGPLERTAAPNPTPGLRSASSAQPEPGAQRRDEPTSADRAHQNEETDWGDLLT